MASEPTMGNTVGVAVAWMASPGLSQLSGAAFPTALSPGSSD